MGIASENASCLAFLGFNALSNKPQTCMLQLKSLLIYCTYEFSVIG